MDNNVNKIFKDKIIGSPSFQKVINNRILGVNGEMSNIIPLINQTLTTQQRIDPYHLQYFYERSQYYNDLGLGPGGTTNINIQAGATFNHTFNYNIPISLLFETPIKNVTKDTITVNFVYKKINITGNTTLGALQTIYDYVRQNNLNRDEYISLNTDLGYPLFNYPGITTEVISENIDISNSLEINEFSINFNIVINKILNGLININYIVLLNTIQSNLTLMTIYQPYFIEFTIFGDTYQIMTQSFQIGEVVNNFQLSKSTLVTTRSNKGGIPLYQYLSNKIINEWYGGKQISNLTKIINVNEDLEQKDTDVILINSRENNFIDNSQSFSVNADGTARVFTIDSATIEYDGSLRQQLILSESKGGDLS